jgi:hypothetical protein
MNSKHRRVLKAIFIDPVLMLRIDPVVHSKVALAAEVSSKPESVGRRGSARGGREADNLIG